ncbi:hypothetical protein [Hespellia stercorisuis]|uniref:Uncharacterized protein n=1 Tax=Hespellia stercorisuis DSM 15480 TaxID=1121950 RepID=A0A1M6TP39_9FIRM|nr:hypothetical protein [Hespellia stercorisuis]SHK58707.1 hypothetical protein SAMN02745243_03285 [Hespellia stercorisuis DSM 15480]
MYEGNPATLKIEKTIALNGVFEESSKQCRVLHYDPEDDYMKLTLEGANLTEIQRDAKYRCSITTKKEVLSCTGIIRDRYQSEEGDVLFFKIENGFYSTPREN